MRPVPSRLGEILLACLKKDRNERPVDAADLWHRLGDVTLEPPWTQERAEHWWTLNVPEDRPVQELRND
ncbi:MAG: hypothetical protein JRG76_18360 [Deltaproteobacteria bacterium]|nr:hypothetical protein [Deltaproteobacteria bacterium]